MQQRPVLSAASTKGGVDDTKVTFTISSSVLAARVPISFTAPLDEAGRKKGPILKALLAPTEEGKIVVTAYIIYDLQWMDCHVCGLDPVSLNQV